jgi:hypothetical protein
LVPRLACRDLGPPLGQQLGINLFGIVESVHDPSPSFSQEQGVRRQETAGEAAVELVPSDLIATAVTVKDFSF